METSWQLAGLTGDGTGLTRPVKTSPWKVPAAVELEGDRLRWRYVDGNRVGKVIRVRPGLVEASFNWLMPIQRPFETMRASGGFS